MLRGEPGRSGGEAERGAE